MPAIRNRIAISGAEVIDAFALNADSTNAATGNINLDDADPADTVYYLSGGQDGIRHQWLVDNTAMTTNAGGDAPGRRRHPRCFRQYGQVRRQPQPAGDDHGPGNVLGAFLGLTNVLTVDKFGPDAVVRTGQLAAYRGIPIIVSASHPLAEADGKVSTTAGNNTLGSVSIMNTMMWYAGFRRELLVEVDRDVQKRQWIMVNSFAPGGGRSRHPLGCDHTAGIRNILIHEAPCAAI